MAIEIAAAYMPVIPSLKGAQKSITSQLTGINLQNAGLKMGNNLAKPIGDSLSKAVKTSLTSSSTKALDVATAATKNLTTAELNLTKARASQKNANAKVESAEEKLAEIRKSGKASSAELKTAEANLYTAKANLAESNVKVTNAEQAHSKAKTNSAAASKAYSKALATESTLSGKLSSTLPTIATGFQLVGTKVQSVGTSISSVGSKVTSTFTKPVVTATTLVGGLVAALGFKRLVGIDTARGQFQGLGYDAQAVMDQVDKGVTNTALSMADGASLAVSILATGNLPLQDLEAQLKRVANVSAAYGVDSTQAGYLLNLVLTKNKVTYGDLSQMVQNQIPIISALAEYYGVAGDEIEGMAQRGEISIEDFNKVLDDKSGKAAEAYAGTWAGITSNITSNIGRIGASILEGAFPQAKEKLSEFLTVLKSDEGKTMAAELGQKISDAFTKIVDAIKNAINWWKGLSPEVQNLALKLGLVVVAAGPLLQVFGKLLSPVGLLIKGIGAMIAAVGGMSTAFAGGTLAANASTASIVGYRTGLVAAYVAEKASTVAKKAATAAQWLFNAALNANPIGLVVTAIAALVAGLTWFFTQTELGQEIWGNFTKFLGTAWEQYGKPIVDAIATAFTWLWESIIKPVVDFVVAYFQRMWTAFQTAGQWIANIANAIGTAITWLWESIIKPVVDFIVGYFTTMWNVWATVGEIVATTIYVLFAAAFTWLWESLIKPVIDFIVLGWTTLSNWFSGTLVPAIQLALATIGGFFSNLWNTYVKPVIDWITAKWNGLVTWFNTVLVPAIKTIMNNIGAFFKGLWSNYVQPVITTITNGWNTLTGFFTGTIVPIIQTVTDAMGKAFNIFKDTVSNVMNKVKELAAKPINFVIETVYRDGLKNFVDKVAEKLGLDLRLPDIEPVKFAKGGVLPGYGPGRDIIPSILSPGEGVLVPEAVRGLGPGFVGWANQHFSGGRSKGGLGTGTSSGISLFSEGGIAGWFSDAVTGLGNFLKDPLGAIAELVTKPVEAILGGIDGTLFGEMGKGAVRTILNVIPDWFKGKADSELGGGGLVSAAMRAVTANIPYVWGGSSWPPGLDCSGLVYWAAQQLGLNWPRLTAAGYQAASSTIGLGSVTPGDLLYWGNPAWHVAIAAGNGMMIEEPKPGLNARYTPIWGSPTAGKYGGGGGVGMTSTYAGLVENTANQSSSLADFTSRLRRRQYDSGGPLHTGWTLAYNGTGKTEHVYTAEDNAELTQGLGGRLELVLEDGTKLAAFVRRAAGIPDKGRVMAGR